MSTARNTLASKKPTSKGIKVKLKDKSPKAKAFLRERNSYFRAALKSLMFYREKRGAKDPPTKTELETMQRRARITGDRAMQKDLLYSLGKKVRRTKTQAQVTANAQGRQSYAKYISKKRKTSQSLKK